MKKGLLLSVVASGFIFAGGNIAPVQPVVPAAAPAACDFWGTVALRYDAMKKATGGNKWKADSKTYLALAMGVEKELGYGFGFGAEMGAMLKGNYKFTNKSESAEVSQFYVTYKAGNTAIKVGRQALPKAVSPWAWSDRTAGVLNRTYNAITVVNTDIADTTLVGAWVHSAVDTNKNVKIADNKGIFMLGAIYSGISNTTLSTSIYYKPKGDLGAIHDFNGDGNADAEPNVGTGVSVWAAAETKVSNFDLGLQVAYAKIKPLTKSFGVAAYAGTKFDAIDAKLTLAYLNDGTTPLNLGGTSAFWGNTFQGVFGGDVSANGKQKIARLDLGYALSNGRIYGGVAADKPDNGATAVAARIGYDFKVSGIAAKVEYRFDKDFNKNKNHRIRVQGVYKF